jgi:hypothetical protein
MTDPVDAELDLLSNGVSAVTGRYALRPVRLSLIAKRARNEMFDEDEAAELRDRADERIKLGHKAPFDVEDLAAAGWGVIFAQGSAPDVREALKPLLEHRAEAAGDLYREFVGENGALPGDSSLQFLERNGIAPGTDPAPRRLPYHLLVVGDPESVSFSFQYQLDVVRSVGRLSLPDADAYARYAEGVVAAEAKPRSPAKSAAFFGPRNPGDRATALSASQLVAPLSTRLAAQRPNDHMELVPPEDATRARLQHLLSEGSVPDLLFTATHGISFPDGHPLQLAHQGALLCQDWPGPRNADVPVPEDQYLAGDALAKAAPAGLIAFLFACYGAGTPMYDDFTEDVLAERSQIAPKSFIAGLPNTLLGHPRGSALAVVGHVARAWSFSFAWPGLGAQLEVFERGLGDILGGSPVGIAMEYFNDRYAALATELLTAQRNARFGVKPTDGAMAFIWTGMNDARNYLILGDPAVRLS